jgi:8-oxo-dGTP pyrophosphatase MutT (NUDIX family)
METVNDIDERLAAFLAGQTPRITEPLAWGDALRFDVAVYLGTDLPPLPLVTSVRAIVRREDMILVQEDRDSRHILPGGRREAGEVPEATLRREVREETGWAIGRPTVIGFMHYHHLNPRPPDYAYPYPDFCQIVYAAWAVEFDESAVLADEYVMGTESVPVVDVRRMVLSQREHYLLEAALALDPP